MTRWTTSELEHFQARRSPDGRRTSASVRSTGAGRSSNCPTEFNIHTAIVAQLKFRAKAGVLFWHVPNGELRDPRLGAKLKAMGTLPGLPDLMILYAGRLYALEIKRGDGRLSTEQRRAHADLELAGAIVSTAWGLDEAISILIAWGLLKPDGASVKTSAPTLSAA